jgi:hypothetical protein
MYPGNGTWGCLILLKMLLWPTGSRNVQVAVLHTDWHCLGRSCYES